MYAPCASAWPASSSRTSTGTRGGGISSVADALPWMLRSIGTWRIWPASQIAAWVCPSPSAWRSLSRQARVARILPPRRQQLAITPWQNLLQAQGGHHEDDREGLALARVAGRDLCACRAGRDGRMRQPRGRHARIAVGGQARERRLPSRRGKTALRPAYC